MTMDPPRVIFATVPSVNHVALAVAHHQVLDITTQSAELRIPWVIALEGASDLLNLLTYGRAL